MPITTGNSGIFDIEGTTLVVEMTNQADNKVIADAIWIESVQALRVDAGLPQAPAPTLTEPQLAPLVDEAIRRLTASEGAAAAAALAGVQVELADLPGDLLGETATNLVRIDRDAAGHGWYVDPTPGFDEEFWRVDGSTHLTALPESPAAIRADLLTSVMHELGHVLGYEDSTTRDLMDGFLSLGTRRLPGERSPTDEPAG